MPYQNIYISLNKKNEYFGFKIAGYRSGGTIKSYYMPRQQLEKILDQNSLSKAPGIYLLLNINEYYSFNHDTDVYVGQTTDLYKRLNEHDVKKESWWNLAIAFVKSNTKEPFNLTEIYYLERYIYNQIKESNQISLYSDHTPAGVPSISNTDKSDFLNDFHELDILLRILGFPILVKPNNKIMLHSKILKRKNSNKLKYFCMTGRHSNAVGVINNLSDGSFKVLAGSKISPKKFGSSFNIKSMETFNKLINKNIIKNGIFLKDYVFSSPSKAARIVYKCSVNGREYWLDKNDNKKTLGDYLNNKNY